MSKGRSVLGLEKEGWVAYCGKTDLMGGEPIKTLKKYIWLTRALAVICLIAGLLSHLALTDIAHGEPDVGSEWAIVQVSAFLVLLFILSTLITLRRFERLYSGKADGQKS